MSQLQVDGITNANGDGSPGFPHGLTVTGIITATLLNQNVTGIITAGAGINAVGVITAGSGIDINGEIGLGAGSANGTSGQVLTSGGSGASPSWSTIAPTATGIASGAIPANRALCVFSDGKVGLITGTKLTYGPTAEVGSSPPQINQTMNYDIAYGGGKVFITAREGPNSGRCIAGTPNADGVTVTWGTWTQYEAAIDSYSRVVYDSNADKFVIAYNRSNSIKTRVATLSGLSITYGTETELINANAETIEGCFDPDTNQIIWVYKTGANNAYSRIGAISGTSISYGTQVTVAGSNSNGPAGVTYDTKNNKVIIAVGYDGTHSNKGWSYIGTVSGTGYVGNAVVDAGLINENYQYARLLMEYNEERERIIFAAFNGTSMQYESMVGTYASASSITWSGPSRIEKYAAASTGYNAMGYDPYAKEYGLIYNNTSGDLVMFARGKLNPVGSSEPDQMVWSTKQLHKGNYGNVGMSDIGNAFLLSYGEGNYYAAYRLEGFRNSTLSADGSNYIGYSAGAYTNGQDVTIQIVGNVSTQVGLSPGVIYYILGDGGLAPFVDPNLPSSSFKEAGVALDTTKLLIK